ncbi:phosphatidylglycerol lysyltransferase domain-containing protein [Flavimaricola marinus]|uniref:Phosphatidylglycerol lysyltransferase n=1 Tax=Flavimaricola marinus TaxID=1819565 RepID=A0A238LFB3_9RHOB|nr:phosphatidylglycerol lysyltransferase domain-containing protein [Flavimaricola marinus]SMY07646.1 Phosphatidylglycerol lysyltransferase [Flavimaricola marinus]
MASFPRLLPRLFGPVMMIVCGLLLFQKTEPGFGSEVVTALADIAPGAWLLAIVAAIVSLWAVGHYDAIVHSAAGTRIAPARARAAGRRAIAVGQAVGFGTITGALVRWRSLPELGLVDLTKFSVAVSLSFMAAWAVIAGSMAVIVWGGVAGSVLLLGICLLGARLPIPKLPGLPYLRRAHLGGLLVWTLVDTLAAAIVLWAFLPMEFSSSLPLFFFAYLAALGAGMISQSPGGIGAFELTLIALLPHSDPAALLAATLGYRLVYHIGPAILALVILIRPARQPRVGNMQLDLSINSDRARRIAAHPDWGLMGQGACVLLSGASQHGWMVRQAPGTLAAIGPALRRPELSELALAARMRGRIPLLYKCSDREAAAARQAGWSTMVVAMEAMLDPTEFCLDRPALRQLRRKLRGSEKAGVTVEAEPCALPLHEMAEINREWAHAHGGERGFSMGRFCTDLIGDQAVMLAWQNERLVGFATFHKTAAGWGLDLMRHRTDAPSGTMQALVAAGISAAKSESVAHLSLAACPIVPHWPGLLDRLLTKHRKAAAGLTQFKSSFAPRWEPRYAASRDPVCLMAGLAAVTWAVHRPAPTGQSDFRFELERPTCEASPTPALRDIPTLNGPTAGMSRLD